MIVKGHDFPNVTLVGIIAADMSLYASDYRSFVKTFQLLSQAEGRAGRGSIDGEAVIQTYSPENGSIIAASKQDYTEFYNKEILYRTISEYPPVVSLMAVQLTSKDNSLLSDQANKIKDMIGKAVVDIKNLRIIGPADANVAKINDVYRKVIYIKSREYDILVKIKDFIEAQFEVMEENKRASVQFDFNPMSGF